MTTPSPQATGCRGWRLRSDSRSEGRGPELRWIEAGHSDLVDGVIDRLRVPRRTRITLSLSISPQSARHSRPRPAAQPCRRPCLFGAALLGAAEVIGQRGEFRHRHGSAPRASTAPFLSLRSRCAGDRFNASRHPRGGGRRISAPRLRRPAGAGSFPGMPLTRPADRRDRRSVRAIGGDKTDGTCPERKI